MKTLKGPIKKIKKEKAGSYNKKKGPTVFFFKKTRLRYCFLRSFLKIMSYGFFFLDEIVFFKLSSHMAES